MPDANRRTILKAVVLPAAALFSKVLDADLTRQERMQILGGNLRRIAEPILRIKGYKT
jgi:hypothetical protein